MDNDRALRPKFHITGGNGWINDPNGLIVHNGRYHAFFQYNPHGTEWGNISWGHVVSDDLTHWKQMPVALVPSTDGADKDGCFSGSAIEWNGKIWLLYTGHSVDECTETVTQVQCLASSSDGTEFTKHGVVIGSELLPQGYCRGDFRDPKVWRKNGKFWCVLAARAVGGKGRVLLYSSKDMFDWLFVGDLFGKDSDCDMIECPDYIDDLGVLTVSEMSRPPEWYLHLNSCTTRWMHGSLDYEKGKFEYRSSGICDHGFDFYAPQSFNGAPILIAWLNMWGRSDPAKRYGFNGMLSVPRELSVMNGELCQRPIVNSRKVYETTVSGKLEDKFKTGMLAISVEELRKFKLLLRKSAQNHTRFELEDGVWVFDRSMSGEQITGIEKDADSVAGIRRMPYSDKKTTDIVIVGDEFSVEIFVDGKVLSSLLYPDHDADALELEIDCASCVYSRYEIAEDDREK